jgi:flagellar biogenesis protein FliO
MGMLCANGVIRLNFFIRQDKMSLVIALFVFFMYMFPTIAAARCDNKNTQAISVLNILLGWTFIGWVVCLVWAVKK